MRLTAKLKKKGFDTLVVKEVVSRFLERNLLNDTRYAELWIRSRLSTKRKLTPLWLLSSLAKRGINRDSSKKALEKVLDPEIEFTMLLIYLKNSNSLEKKEPWVQKALLKREGFSPEVLEKFTTGG